MKKILMTGGGTAGHVTPNIALMPALREAGYSISYIGRYEGIEKELISKQEDVKYYGISSGKLRRYLDIKNLSDPFKVIKGYSEAVKLIKHIKPDVVFSKGGFVTVPVILAAKRCKVPSIIHESDLTPGLANKIAIPNASFVCCNFPETLNYLPDGKKQLTGSPIRKELLEGDSNTGLQFLGFDNSKPVLLVMGGSTGSAFINNALRDSLDLLLETFQIVHLCGKDKTDPSLEGRPGYRQFEYIDKELTHIFAAADIVVSRAGANAIFELLALKKPNILIPLSAAASRGDQILNAQSFKKQGFSEVLEEETLDDKILIETINDVYNRRNDIIKTMENSQAMDSITAVVDLIKKVSK